MVRIGVISDTHYIDIDKVVLPKKIKEVFEGVDIIFHAGDIISPKVLKELARIAPVLAVRGNMDLSDELIRLPQKLIENVEDVKIGLVHGWGPPSGIIDRISREFPPTVDCIVFGHTHSACSEKRGNVLFFNPGAAVDRIYSLVNSVGLLIVDGSKIDPQIIEI